MSQLILVPVPGTTSQGKPVVRVVVVPKLDAARSAAEAGLDDWPTILAAATFQVSLNEGPPIDVTATHEADVEVWRSFFRTLRVDAAAAPEIGDPPEVRATSAEVANVDKTYRAAAAVDVDPASGSQDDLGVAAARELRDRWSSGDPAVPVPGVATVAPAPDFHRVLGMLREHPAVMRRLGLVFDLPLPEGSALGDAGTVRIRWTNPPAGVPQPVSPRSAYDVDDDRGLVPGRTASARAGLIDLGDTDLWMTTTLDIDNAVTRLRDAAASLGPAPAAGAEAEVDGAVRLPALRSAGILLLRKGRENDFANRRNAAARNAALPSVEDAEPLTADDLTLGLRFDVRSKGAAKWTSLVRREARYTVDGNDILPLAEEEGHVKPGAAVQQGDGSLRADEIVARWNGWSLAVPQSSPGTRHADRRQDLPFDFSWAFKVPDESLLPLRFAHEYQLRSRIADLAGGGVGPEDRDVNTGTEAITYTRHEPIGSPTVTLAEGLGDLGPGGALDMVVIRSDAADYPRNDERMLSAPKATLDVAEQHGMLDGSDEETFQRVRRALNGGLPDPASAGVTVFVVPEPGGVASRTHFLAWPEEDWPEAPDKRLLLVAREDDDPPIDPDAAKDVVRVQLAPAEQVTLALSSFLRRNFLDHFALQQWRLVDSPVQVVRDGRHPMATPAHEVTFVHAVRRPLTDPSGSLTPVQEPCALAAILTPEPARLNVDTASTQQLQIAAAWKEVDDHITTEMTGVAVQNVPVSRGDDALQQQIVHQFGDTRHRMVTYSFVAVSRFRHFFKANEEATRFVGTGKAAPISIKSTVRPAPPAVRAVVPAFRWTSEVAGSVIRHVRSGGTLRVELLRPWHLTGQDEQLAIIVEQTEVARDPIWLTPTVGRTPPLSAFLPASGETRKLPDGTPVTVVACDTKFFEDCWWVADVEIPGIAAASYRPFVRLAVARYQRESLTDLELSAVVRTDLVQLLPERTVTVDTGGAGLLVKLEGLGPQGPNENRVDVITERRTAASVIEVSVLSPTDEVDAWSAVEIASGKLGDQIQLSRPAAAAGTLRVRVREVELLAAAGQPPAAQTGSAGELAERVVFTDLISIP